MKVCHNSHCQHALSEEELLDAQSMRGFNRESIKVHSLSKEQFLKMAQILPLNPVEQSNATKETGVESDSQPITLERLKAVLPQITQMLQEQEEKDVEIDAADMSNFASNMSERSPVLTEELKVDTDNKTAQKPHLKELMTKIGKAIEELENENPPKTEQSEVPAQNETTTNETSPNEVAKLQEIIEIKLDSELNAKRRNLERIIVLIFSRTSAQNHQFHNYDKDYTRRKEDESWVVVVSLQKSHENKLGYGLVISFAIISMVGGAVSIGSAGLGFAGKFNTKGLERAGQIGTGISTIGQGGMNLKEIATNKEKATQVLLEQELDTDKRKRSDRADSANQEDQQVKRNKDEVLQLLKMIHEAIRALLQS